MKNIGDDEFHEDKELTESMDEDKLLLPLETYVAQSDAALTVEMQELVLAETGIRTMMPYFRVEDFAEEIRKGNFRIIEGTNLSRASHAVLHDPYYSEVSPAKYYNGLSVEKYPVGLVAKIRYRDTYETQLRLGDENYYFRESELRGIKVLAGEAGNSMEGKRVRFVKEEHDRWNTDYARLRLESFSLGSEGVVNREIGDKVQVKMDDETSVEFRNAWGNYLKQGIEFRAAELEVITPDEEIEQFEIVKEVALANYERIAKGVNIRRRAAIADAVRIANSLVEVGYDKSDAYTIVRASVSDEKVWGPMKEQMHGPEPFRVIQ